MVAHVIFCFVFRLVDKEIIDRLKVVRSQETLLIFNENVEMAVAHISVRYCAVCNSCLCCFFVFICNLLLCVYFIPLL